MSAVLFIVAFGIGAACFFCGSVLFLAGVSNATTVRYGIKVIVATVAAFLCGTVGNLVLLFESAKTIESLHLSAEGGYTEARLAGHVALGSEYWILLAAALATSAALRNTIYWRAVAGGAFFAFGSFNVFVMLYGVKILRWLGVMSSSMVDWCC